MTARIWYQVVDSRSKHDFTVQHVMPPYLEIETGELCMLPLLASRSEADVVVRVCNKAAGGEFFSHKRVIVSDAP